MKNLSISTTKTTLHPLPFSHQTIKHTVRKRLMASAKDIDKEGNAYIAIEVEAYVKRLNWSQPVRKIKRFNSGIRIKPGQWNQKKKEIRNDAQLNFRLNQKVLEVQTWINDLHSDGFNTPLPTELEGLYDLFPKQKKAGPKTLLNYLDDYIEYRKGESVKRGSWKEFITLKNKLVRYDAYRIEQELKPLQFEDITLTFSDNFKKWMRDEPYESKIEKGKTVKKYYDANTIKKTFVTLGTFLNHFYKRRQELNIDLSEAFKADDFGRVAGTVEAPPITLTQHEIDVVFKSNKAVDKNVYLSKIRLAMLLQIGVGCRVSDLFKLGTGKNYFTDTEIVYFPTKTETIKKKNEIRVPVNTYSSYVLKKIDFKIEAIAMTDQHYNRGIKDLLKELGIDAVLKEYEVSGKEGRSTYKKWEVFSSHNCRDTFISRMIEIGVPVPIILEWVGQTDYAVMRKYIKTDSKVKAEYMAKW